MDSRQVIGAEILKPSLWIQIQRTLFIPALKCFAEVQINVCVYSKTNVINKYSQDVKLPMQYSLHPLEDSLDSKKSYKLFVLALLVGMGIIKVF